MGSTLVAFVGGAEGPWHVERLDAVTGPALPRVDHLSVVADPTAAGSFADATWILRGAVSYERYVRRTEHDQLVRRQADLGRAGATRAALIPISKSPEWWALSQDERRDIFEERSHHIATSLDYLPAVARRLHHGHDIGEPFDFLTWFEYAPAASEAFEQLVNRLRQTEEWTYVEREVDIRLVRTGC
ncbi:MAG: chlorite dismutase family protein [Pseudonocardiales bacterium]